MKIFTDWHHGSLGRSLILLLGDRLGHEVFGPADDLCKFANIAKDGTWLTPNVRNSGGMPPHLTLDGEAFTVNKEQFLEINWDAVIISRPESVPVFQTLLSQHPRKDQIKRIGQAGNEGQVYDWDWIPNFLSSDYLSYMRAPASVNKIHYMQESGRQFQPETFTPLTQESLKTINTFINCLASFNGWEWNKDRPYWDNRCPHCETTEFSSGPSASVFSIWNGMKSAMPDIRFMDYGIDNTQGMISERELPEKITGGALTWGYKTYDGYGHSIAQSISMGRLCIVPRRFHRYRTANQFLIPNLTCLEADWDTESCVKVIQDFTADLDRANEMSEACFKAAKGIFNWKHESERVKTFISQLR